MRYVTGIVVIAVFIAAGLYFWKPSDALVHLTIPSGYQFAEVGPMSSPVVYQSVSLPSGIITIHLRKGKSAYACVVNVKGGGEMYLPLAETDLVRVVDVQEAR